MGFALKDIAEMGIEGAYGTVKEAVSEGGRIRTAAIERSSQFLQGCAELAVVGALLWSEHHRDAAVPDSEMPEANPGELDSS